MMKNKKKGFTLVELLAVIVILAIILVIAVPQIMKTIEEARKGALVSSAKMIAASAETMYLSNTTLGISSAITCDDVAEINDTDYESCSIKFDDNGKAKVSIVGKGKFEGMSVCSGTRENAVVTDQTCSTNVSCFEYKTIASYTVKDYDSCIAYTKELFTGNWGYSDEEHQSFCRGEEVDGYTFSENIQEMIDYWDFTEEELIENNVINVAAEIEITGYDATCGTDVVIPSTIDGGKVISIGERAFSPGASEYTNAGTGIVKNIILPDTIEYIYDYAFAGNSIENITFSKNLKEIGDYAFYRNYIDGELDLSEVTNLTFIGDLAFYENNITKVLLPVSIEYIAPGAFKYNNITSITNPSSNSFDWHYVLAFNGENCTFVTGTCGDIAITAE